MIELGEFSNIYGFKRESIKKKALKIDHFSISCSMLEKSQEFLHVIAALTSFGRAILTRIF